MYSEFCDNSLSGFLLIIFPSIYKLLVLGEGKELYPRMAMEIWESFFPFK